MAQQILEKGIEDVYKFKREIKMSNFKINAMDESNNSLYLGDQNGKLHKYTIYRKSAEFLSENPVVSRQLCSQKIDQIKALPFGKDLLVIANSQLFHVDGDSLMQKQTINLGNVVNLYNNEASTHKNEILVQLKNNKLIVIEFNINTGEYISEKVQITTVSDTPITVAFLANIIYYGTKKEYFQIDLNKKLTPTSIPNMIIALSPQIKVTDNDELLMLVTNNNTGLLIGDQLQRENLERDAYDMLVNVLEKMRYKYSRPQFKQFTNQKMTFNSSVYTLVRQERELELQEIQKLIDFALIKVCLKRKEYSKKLCDLFRGKEPINCKQYYDEIHQALLQDKIDQKDPQVIAYFYEKFDKIKDALERWKTIGSQLNSRYENACNETIRILLEQEDSKRITEYLGWVTRKNLEYAKSFFNSVKESVIPPEQMLSLINDGIYSSNEQGLAERLAEIYLDIIITKKKVVESRFHNKLAILYINNLFNLIPKGTNYNEIKWTDQARKIYDKFQAFYKDPNSNYEPSFLLEKVQNSWLINEEIYFCGKSKKHTEALSKLIIELNSHTDAENYCLQHNDKTLTTMFNIYMNIFQSTKEYLNKKNLSQQDKANLVQVNQTWINRINIFLKKYSTHPQLDTFEVLNKIPDDWVLQELVSPQSTETQTANDGLYSFLTQTISSSLHNRRQVNCAKYLSEMDLQNVKCNLINTKKAYVRITEEKKCAICHKSIGDKTVCVYPNAVVADQKCVSNGQSLTVCPQTNQDFEKTFRG